MTNMLTRSNVFDDLFRDLTTGFYVKPLHGDSMPRSIRTDVSEDAEAYRVHAEIPGVSKEDIHIDIDGAVISIKAEIKQHDSKKEGDAVLRTERYYGAVSRSFELPQEVDIEHAKAEYKDGILYLTLPKKTRQETQRRLTVN
ncbi:MAG: Hsp20/alpha crystallin family protein [Thalassolituus sp.]